jgi:adenylate kinase family enzyme
MYLYRTDVGVMAEELVKRGELVSDDIMLKILTNKLDSLHNQVRLYWSR